MNEGDRVVVARSKRVRPDLKPMYGAMGTITRAIGPFFDGESMEDREHEVTFDNPVGPKKITVFYPLFNADLERLART